MNDANVLSDAERSAVENHIVFWWAAALLVCLFTGLFFDLLVSGPRYEGSRAEDALPMALAVVSAYCVYVALRRVFPKSAFLSPRTDAFSELTETGKMLESAKDKLTRSQLWALGVVGDRGIPVCIAIFGHRLAQVEKNPELLTYFGGCILIGWAFGHWDWSMRKHARPVMEQRKG